MVTTPALSDSLGGSFVPRTRIPSGRRLRRLLSTSALTVTLTALGSGVVPLLAPAAPHPVRTSMHTVSLTAGPMAVARGARVPALPASTLAEPRVAGTAEA